MKLRTKRKTHYVWLGTIAGLGLAVALLILFQYNRYIVQFDALSVKANKQLYVRQDPIAQIPNAKPIRLDSSQMSRPDGLWLLVNKSNDIPKDYVPNNLTDITVTVRPPGPGEVMKIRPEVIRPLENMFAAAESDGVDLMIGSSYRSATLQQQIFNDYAAASGEAAANLYSAFPGQSEHQTGLAIDVSTRDRACYLDECFIDTVGGQWMADNGYKYGFILRYPKGKESITGYQYEPWHYRYVGTTLSNAVQQSGLTLEEIYPYLDGSR